MNKLSLAARRAELIERCAEQRTGLAFELHALRPSSVLGGVLGLALVRRKGLLALGASAMSAWRIAQGGLALLARFRK